MEKQFFVDPQREFLAINVNYISFLQQKIYGFCLELTKNLNR